MLIGQEEIQGCLLGFDGTDSFFPETSVRSHHYALRNSPEERRFHLPVGASLK
jgi:hypothetical protein